MAAQVGADLLQTDGDRGFAMRFLRLLRRFLAFFMMVVSARASRNAIIAVEEADGSADAELVADQGKPDAGTLLLRRRVWNAPALAGKFKRFGGLLGMAFLKLLRRDLRLLRAQAR